METTDFAREMPAARAGASLGPARPAFGAAHRHPEGTFNRMQEGRFVAGLCEWAGLYRQARQPGPPEILKALAAKEARAWKELSGCLDSPLFSPNRGGGWPLDEATGAMLEAVRRAQREADSAAAALRRANNHRGWGRSRLDRFPYRDRLHTAQSELSGAIEALAARIAPPPRSDFDVMAEAALMGAA